MGGAVACELWIYERMETTEVLVTLKMTSMLFESIIIINITPAVQNAKFIYLSSNTSLKTLHPLMGVLI